MTTLFPDDEIDRLRAFREAARQVREATIIDQGQSIGMQATVDAGGDVHATFQLLANEPFRSLAMSIRLVYLNKEPANFGRVCRVLVNRTADPARSAIESVRARYNGILNGNSFQFGLHGDLEGRIVGPREFFETWLYHGTFHQEPDRRPVFDELAKFGPRFSFAVHAIALQLAGCILDLDDQIADVLDEVRVRRIDA